MSTGDTTKRIPKSLGTEAQLFGTYTLGDVAIGLLPGVVVLLVLQVVVDPATTVARYRVQSVTLPLVACAIGVGALFVYLTPPYTTSIDWLTTFAGFHGRGREHDYESAKTLTGLEEAHLDDDVLERRDGALVGMVQVTPPSMALATDEEWRATAAAFQSVLDTVVEFPIQLFSTTQEFPTADYVAHYERRLDDPDVKANPRLAALIEHYVAWYTKELAARRMTIRDHYVVVPITPEEVQFEHESLLQQLAAIPVVGVLLRAWFAPPLVDEYTTMVAALDERLRHVERGLHEIEGCTAARVPADEMLSVVASFWHGEPRADGMAARLRTRPLVGGRR
ncbi:hypothetical protein J2752_000154 [Halarchaeum rubridurum]|uniref:PrgI family protein n=1 Tax=Halarchaeum rubridurum TaxID=489911 RepID=A0A830FYD5_9EURY|nr:hypothetical protein [Halarchaeum rubridurum]MBP1953273.1 hypothetical protein [Halarchaeum rubridurum]GGM66545.1 hypothetical protein GCM10009017_15810 [Halarchaeum rubridurum]